MLKQFASSIWGILLFKKGPQDVPYLPTALMVLMGMTLGLMLFIGGSQAVLILANIVYIFVAFWLVLAKANKKQRYVQTMLAYLTCSWIISLVCILFLIAVLYFSISMGVIAAPTPEMMSTFMTSGLAKANLPKGLQTILLIGIFGLLLWRFLVGAHILRHALDVTFQRAIFILFMINLIPMIIQMALPH